MYLIYSHEPEGRSSLGLVTVNQTVRDVTGLSPVGYYGFASYCRMVAMDTSSYGYILTGREINGACDNKCMVFSTAFNVDFQL